MVRFSREAIRGNKIVDVSQKEILDGADICLKVATKCFINYIENDESLREDRDAFKYFVEGYVLARIYSPIYDRIKKEYIWKRVRKNT